MEHLTSYPDFNAKNPLINVRLFEEKIEIFQLNGMFDIACFYEEISR